MNVTLQNLSYSHSSMGIIPSDSLSALKDNLLVVSQDVHKNRQEFDVLSNKLSEFVEHGGKLATEQAILESLNFRRMRDRRSNIVEAHARTFDWIFDEKVEGASSSAKTNFSDWLRNRAGIYWITGKAGSGKSTLMKYLVSHDLVRKSLEDWAGSKSLFTGAYFFWSAGDDMEKSQNGLLQSLLYDILRRCPSVLPELSPDRWASPKLAGTNLDGSWSRTELLESLEWLTKKRTWPAKFCFFVDGVDEYKGDPAEIVDLLENFAASSDVKVILSSRPWTEIESALKPISDQKLVLHDFTQGDIRRYIQDLLVQDRRFQSVMEKDERYEGLVNQILNKAQGVFLWVFLAVRELLKGLTHEDTVFDLENRLRDIPPDLDKFFKRILNSIEKVYHPQTSQIFQMCLAATKPLSLLTFSFLEDEERIPDYAIQASMSPWTSDYMTTRCEVVKKRVKARCRDFLEIVPSRDQVDLFSVIPGVEHQARKTRSDRPMLWVTFLHRTVKDFFLGDDMQALLRDWMKSPFNPHLTLCRSFVMQMKILPPTKEYLDVRDAPFFDLVEDFLYHTGETERHYDSTESTLIEEVDRVAIYHCGGDRTTSNLFDPPELQKRRVAWENPSRLGLDGMSWKPGWILTLSVQACLHIYVRQKLRENPALVNGINKRPLLYCALLFPMQTSQRSSHNYDLTMLQLLLEAKGNPNQTYLETTIWGIFLRNCYREHKNTTADVKRVWAKVFALLLEHGADPDASFETGQSSEKPTFSGRIIRYPIYTTVSEIIEKCCPNEAHLLKAIIERKRGFSIWRWVGWK